MRIAASRGQISPGALFKVVATGHAVGISAILAIAFIVLGVVSIFGPPLEHRLSLLGFIFGFLVIVPFLALVQGVIQGAVATLGLTLYSWFRPIEIESGKEL